MAHRVQVLGWTLVWSGLFIFGYLGWQLYATDVINSQVQAQATEDLRESFEEEREQLPAVEVVEQPHQPDQPDEAEDATSQIVEFHPEGVPEEAASFAYLTVPRLGVEAVVFEGVTRSTLSQGPGHIPGTALPGQPGNAVISGHRTTHGRPFFDFDQLIPGDRIEVETAIGTHVYVVREDPFVVLPTDVWVTNDREGAWLTLTTCNPKFSARERLIITAELVEGPNAAYVDLLADL